MNAAKRWKSLLAGAALSCAFIYGCHGATTGWETITTTFAKTQKPYGGGAFRIRDNRVISLKLAEQPITFKPRGEQKSPGVAEPTEAWMNDSSERLNRRSVVFLKGTLTGELARTFEQPGQDAAWWYSDDWRRIFVSTGWMDYKAPKPNGLAPQFTKLWHSSDGGQQLGAIALAGGPRDRATDVSRPTARLCRRMGSPRMAYCRRWAITARNQSASACRRCGKALKDL